MKTLFVGQNTIHLKSVDSTNSYASELLRQITLSEGSVIYTFHQEKGRGQRGNTWESEPNKNVALSLVLYPSFLTAEKQFLLTEMSSVALADLMAELLGDACKINIKWPNDIYVNDKKIAGILIENSLRESMIQSAIIGIGINVNQMTFSSAPNATSLRLLAGKEFEPLSLIERLCELIEGRYLQLKTNKSELIDGAYLKRLYRINEWANFNSENKDFEGRIKGVSKAGKLQVELRPGEIKDFDLKEITFEP